MDLLSKSKFYSQFLLNKMQDVDEASKLKQKKFSDRKEFKSKRAGKAATSANGRKRKQADSPGSSQSESPDSKKAKKQAEPHRSWGGEDIPDDQPLLLTGGVMRDYQIKGYQWMATLFENGINGILVGARVRVQHRWSDLDALAIPSRRTRWAWARRSRR